MREVKFVQKFYPSFKLYFFSYDALAFRNHADSSYGHYLTSLANYDGSPLVVGGYTPSTNKVEVYNISSNTWAAAEDYPYHEWLVLMNFKHS